MVRKSNFLHDLQGSKCFVGVVAMHAEAVALYSTQVEHRAVSLKASKRMSKAGDSREHVELAEAAVACHYNNMKTASIAIDRQCKPLGERGVCAAREDQMVVGQKAHRWCCLRRVTSFFVSRQNEH